MGRAIEGILAALAEFLGIEAAKFVLGDIFAYLVVTGVVWYGVFLFGLMGLSKLLPGQHRDEDAPAWATALVIIVMIAITVGIWGGSLYLFLSGF